MLSYIKKALFSLTLGELRALLPLIEREISIKERALEEANSSTIDSGNTLILTYKKQ